MDGRIWGRWLLLCAFGWLAGCGDSDGGGGANEPVVLPTTTVAARVTLPAARAVGLAGLTVTNSLGQVAVGDDGSVNLPAFDGGRQLAVVSTAGDIDCIVGLIDADHPELSAHSTAVWLAWCQLALWSLPADLQAEALELLDEEPALEPVTAAIEDALAGDGLDLSTLPEAVSQALQTACENLLEAAEAAGDGGEEEGGESRGVLVTPAEKRSGLTVDTSEGLNQFRLINESRRRTRVIVERLSYVPAGGGDAVAAQETVADFSGPMPNGVAGALGSLVDVLYHRKYAYSAKYSDPVEVPLYPADADSTRYRVTTFGLGLSQGDFASLTEEQRVAWRDVCDEALLTDYMMPLFLNGAIPASKGTIEAVTKAKGSAAMIKDAIGLLKTKVPAAWEKAYLGDVSGALVDLFTAVGLGGTVRGQLFNYLVAREVKVSGLSAEDTVTKKITDQISNGLFAADFLLSTFDFVVQTDHIVEANMADIWTLDVTEPRVSITPQNPSIARFGQVLLQAEFPEGKPEGEGVGLTYTWTIAGNGGTLNNDIYTVGQTSFESTSDWAWYLAEEGVDCTEPVTLTVHVIRDGVKTVLGTATTTITVAGHAFKLQLEQPDEPFYKGGEREITCDIETDFDMTGWSKSFHWRCTSSQGHLFESGAGADDLVTPWPTATFYTEPSVYYLPGQDTLTCEVTLKKGFQSMVIGSATTTIEVVPRPHFTMAAIGVDDDLILTLNSLPLISDSDHNISRFESQELDLEPGDVFAWTVRSWTPTWTYMGAISLLCPGGDTITVDQGFYKASTVGGFGDGSITYEGSWVMPYYNYGEVYGDSRRRR